MCKAGVRGGAELRWALSYSNVLYTYSYRIPTGARNTQGEGGLGVNGADAVGRRRAAEWDLYNTRWKTPMSQELYAQLLEHDKQLAEDHEGGIGTE